MKKTTIIAIVGIILILGLWVYTFLSLQSQKEEIEYWQNKYNELKDSQRDKENSSFDENQQEENNQVTIPDEYDISSFTPIKAQDIAEISQNKKVVILIARSNCGWCRAYVPILKEAQAELDIPIYYINMLDIREIQKVNGEDEWVTIDQTAENLLRNMATNSSFQDFMKENYGKTPLTLVIENNTLIGGIAGWRESSEVVISTLNSFGIN